MLTAAVFKNENGSCDSGIERINFPFQRDICSYVCLLKQSFLHSPVFISDHNGAGPGKIHAIIGNFTARIGCNKLEIPCSQERTTTFNSVYL